MKLTFLLIKNTVLNEMRSKIFLSLVALTFIFFVLIYFLIEHISIEFGGVGAMGMLGAYVPVIVMNIAGWWSIFLAVLLSLGPVRQDERSQVMGQILALPLSRAQYLIARMSGVYLTSLFYYFLSCLLGISVLLLKVPDLDLQLAYIAKMGSDSLFILFYIVPAFLLSLLLPRMIALLSAFFGMIILTAATSSFSEMAFSDYFKDIGPQKGLALLMYFLFPHFNALGLIGQNFILEENLDWGNILLHLGHGVGSIVLLFFICVKIFSKRNY